MGTGIVFHRVARATRLLKLLRDLELEPLLARGAVYVDGRRAALDDALAIDQVLRLHTRPKRYPVPAGGLRERVVFANDEFVVLDKPSGLPTHATLDNALENAHRALGRELGEDLLVTHRLDIPTDGLLILARTPHAQRAINREFERGRVIKRYLARSAGPVDPGEYRHFIDPATHVPRAIETVGRAGWWDCRLIVTARARDPLGHWTHEVRPLTGKTHQIRAQFTALGAALLGDELYGGPPHPRFGLTCAGLCFDLRGTRHEIALPPGTADRQ